MPHLDPKRAPRYHPSGEFGPAILSLSFPSDCPPRILSVCHPNALCPLTTFEHATHGVRSDDTRRRGEAPLAWCGGSVVRTFLPPTRAPTPPLLSPRSRSRSRSPDPSYLPPSLLQDLSAKARVIREDKQSSFTVFEIRGEDDVMGELITR